MFAAGYESSLALRREPECEVVKGRSVESAALGDLVVVVKD